MDEALPPHLASERDAVLREIDEAFSGVRLAGGVSWRESRVIDAYGSDEDRAVARSLVPDHDWRELIGDPEWTPGGGVGGWCFLDAKGFRYYLPAAMVRCVMSGHDEGIAYHLSVPDFLCGVLPEHQRREERMETWSSLDLRQRQCVKRFLRYMLAVCEHQSVEEEAWFYEEMTKDWRDALASYWDSLEDR
jgi:hypothetical protein